MRSQKAFDRRGKTSRTPRPLRDFVSSRGQLQTVPIFTCCCQEITGRKKRTTVTVPDSDPSTGCSSTSIPQPHAAVLHGSRDRIANRIKRSRQNRPHWRPTLSRGAGSRRLPAHWLPMSDDRPPNRPSQKRGADAGAINRLQSFVFELQLANGRPSSEVVFDSAYSNSSHDQMVGIWMRFLGFLARSKSMIRQPVGMGSFPRAMLASETCSNYCSHVPGEQGWRSCFHT